MNNLSFSTKVIISVILLSGVEFICGLVVGQQLTTTREHQNAIDANVGCWQIDAETGERNFVYGVFTKKE